MSSPSRFAKASAVGGLFAWLIFLFLTTADAYETQLIHKVAVFGMLVIVPLGLSIIAVDSWLYRTAVLLQPFAALLAAASFLFDMGLLAALLSSAWLILTVLVALLGVTRIISRGLYPLAELSIDAGLLYLPVAGIWLVIYRLGAQPLGYGETIILLTVVHFHFAGFAAPIIAGASGRVLATRAYRRWVYAFSVFAIVAAIPLVAAGITFTAVVGLIGTLLLAIGLVALAVLNIGWVIPAIGPAAKRSLLVIGAASSCAAMVLACLYAYSLVAQTLIITIPGMAMTHGLLNAFGFVGCSLLAYTLPE
jgi:YndJ-like protein